MARPRPASQTDPRGSEFQDSHGQQHACAGVGTVGRVCAEGATAIEAVVMTAATCGWSRWPGEANWTIGGFECLTTSAGLWFGRPVSMRTVTVKGRPRCLVPLISRRSGNASQCDTREMVPMPAKRKPVECVIGLPLVIWNGSPGAGALQPRLRSPIRTPVVPFTSGCAMSMCAPSHSGSVRPGSGWMDRRIDGRAGSKCRRTGWRPATCGVTGRCLCTVLRGWPGAVGLG